MSLRSSGYGRPSPHQHPQADIVGLAAALALLATKQELTDRINALLNGAPAALDTLKEIADRFASEDTEQDAMLAALAARLRFDAAQTLTSTQQAQGRSNLGIDLAALLARLGPPAPVTTARVIGTAFQPNNGPGTRRSADIRLTAKKCALQRRIPNQQSHTIP